MTLSAPPSPSSDRYPSFSGTASDHTPVTVDIYKGTAAEGPVVASASAEAESRRMVVDEGEPALEWGTYTAVATQPSSLGNPSGTSSPATFAVQPIPPTVATEPASLMTRNSATLYASVDPEGGPVSECYFEYGPTTAYGASIECGFVSEIGAFPAADTSAVPVFARIFGLRASTTYHFRVVAVGEGGTAVGTDQTFTTLPPYSFPEEGSRAAKAASTAKRSASGVLSAKQLKTLIAQQLGRLWRTAHIDDALKNWRFRINFKAPEAGTAQIPGSMTRRTPGVRARPSAPILVASAELAFRAPSTRAMTMRLTNAGRDLLRRSKRLHILTACKFSPPHARALTTFAAFDLTA